MRYPSIIDLLQRHLTEKILSNDRAQQGSVHAVRRQPQMLNTHQLGDMHMASQTNLLIDGKKSVQQRQNREDSSGGILFNHYSTQYGRTLRIDTTALSTSLQCLQMQSFPQSLPLARLEAHDSVASSSGIGTRVPVCCALPGVAAHHSLAQLHRCRVVHDALPSGASAGTRRRRLPRTGWCCSPSSARSTTR